MVNLHIKMSFKIRNILKICPLKTPKTFGRFCFKTTDKNEKEIKISPVKHLRSDNGE